MELFSSNSEEIDDNDVLKPEYEGLIEAMSEGEEETVLLEVESEDNRRVQDDTEQDNNNRQKTTDKNNSKQQTARRKNDRILWEKISNSQSHYEVHPFENTSDVGTIIFDTPLTYLKNFFKKDIS